MTRRPALARALALTAAIALTATMTGCAPILEAFNGSRTAPIVTPNPAPAGAEEATSAAFESAFTDDGSVSLVTDVADGLQLRLDVWAAAPKRTLEWTPTGDKTFGFAMNVDDLRVDEKAVLTQKRRVYVSQVSITSQTTQTSQQTSAPFQFAADPRTLVPTDTQRSERGLLLNSYQGGLLVPETTIHQLPDDTYGITLQFAVTVAVESTANDDTSFQQQTVYQVLPIGIHSSEK